MIMVISMRNAFLVPIIFTILPSLHPPSFHEMIFILVIYSNTYPVIFAMLYYTSVVFSMYVHEFYLMHLNTVYVNDNLTP